MAVLLDTDHLSVLQWEEQPDSTLLSRNLRDFRQVPGLNAEDWTA